MNKRLASIILFGKLGPALDICAMHIGQINQNKLSPRPLGNVFTILRTNSELVMAVTVAVILIISVFV